jgi:hypothetical protein
MSDDPQKPEDENSQAFDDLAQGVESEPDMPKAEDVGDFTDSFSENYVPDEAFEEFETFDDSEFEGDNFYLDPAMEEPIDAEFSEFQESEFATTEIEADSEFPAGDGWEDESAQEEFSDGTPKQEKVNAQASSPLLAMLSGGNAKFFNYAVYGVVGLVVVIIGYLTLFSGGESQQTPQLANVQQQQGEVAQPNQEPQTLSGILNSGTLAAKQDAPLQGNTLDNLDALETKMLDVPVPKTASEQLANSDQVADFGERQSLGGLPSPTPISNEMAVPARNVDAEPLAPLLSQGINRDAAPADITAQPQVTTMSDFEVYQPKELGDGFNDGLSLPAPFGDAKPKETPSQTNAEAVAELQAIEKQAEKIGAEEAMEAQAKSSGSNQELIVLAQTLTENMTRFEQQTAAFVERIEAVEQKMGGTEGVAPSDYKKLADSIEALNKKVSTLERKAGQTPAPRAASSSSTNSNTSNATSTPRTQPVAQKPAMKWELRAASPNQAWVSRQGNNTLKQVSVGDQLEGLGVINSIVMNNGRWVVSASQGRITQ